MSSGCFNIESTRAKGRVVPGFLSNLDSAPEVGVVVSVTEELVMARGATVVVDLPAAVFRKCFSAGIKFGLPT